MKKKITLIIVEKVNESVNCTIYVYYLVAFRKNALPFAV